MINITERRANNTGWQINSCFQIKLHTRDKELLIEIKSFFNEIGSISFSNDNGVMYRVNKLYDIINVIIPHFNKYPLITQKYGDFVICKNIIELMNKKEHLNKNNLIKIINLKTSLNKGLPDKFKLHFPNYIKIKKPNSNFIKHIDYNWIAGFFSGEGCFSIDVYKAIDRKTGYDIRLRAKIDQHSRDELLMNNLITSLGCGNICKSSNRKVVTFYVAKFEDINIKIIPLFNEYKIRGVKALDFKD